MITFEIDHFCYCLNEVKFSTAAFSMYENLNFLGNI